MNRYFLLNFLIFFCFKVLSLSSISEITQQKFPYRLLDANGCLFVNQTQCCKIDDNSPYEYLVSGPFRPCVAIIFTYPNGAAMFHLDEVASVGWVKEIVTSLNLSPEQRQELKITLYTTLAENLDSLRLDSLPEFNLTNQKQALAFIHAMIKKFLSITPTTCFFLPTFEYLQMTNDRPDWDSELYLAVNCQGIINHVSQSATGILPQGYAYTGWDSLSLAKRKIVADWSISQAHLKMLVNADVCTADRQAKELANLAKPVFFAGEEPQQDGPWPVVKQMAFPQVALCHQIDCFEKATKTCTGCKLCKYCSKDCQTKDWRSHKPQCKKLALDFSQAP